MSVRRIVAYAGGRELIASRDFYVEVLGMEIAMQEPDRERAHAHRLT